MPTRSIRRILLKLLRLVRHATIRGVPRPWRDADRPVTFAGVLALMLTTAAATTWIPARRAAAIDPMVSLRED